MLSCPDIDMTSYALIKCPMSSSSILQSHSVHQILVAGGSAVATALEIKINVKYQVLGNNLFALREKIA